MYRNSQTHKSHQSGSFPESMPPQRGKVLSPKAEVRCIPAMLCPHPRTVPPSIPAADQARGQGAGGEVLHSPSLTAEHDLSESQSSQDSEEPRLITVQNSETGPSASPSSGTDRHCTVHVKHARIAAHYDNEQIWRYLEHSAQRPGRGSCPCTCTCTCP